LPRTRSGLPWVWNTPETISTLKGLHTGDALRGYTTLTGLNELVGRGSRGSPSRVNPGLNDRTPSGFSHRICSNPNPGLNDGTLTGFPGGIGPKIDSEWIGWRNVQMPQWLFPVVITFTRHTQMVVTN
jgi:hypothetical protein